MSYETKLLVFSGAFALGEALVASAPCLVQIWPAVLVALLFAALFGYGLAAPGWPLGVAFLVGMLAFSLAAREAESTYRDKPWLRASVRRNVSGESGRAQSVRRALSRRVVLGLETRRGLANLNRAILLGERWRLDRRTKNVFAEAGTMHIFAISGLHVMIVARVLVVVALFLFIPLRWAGIVALLPLWAYVYVIGMPASAVRAATMASFYYASALFWRKPNALVAWSLAFLSLHLARPSSIADVGSQLSFSVMLALVLASRAAPEGWSSGWRGTLWIGFAAWLAGLPAALTAFGRITPAAILANLVLLPTAEVSVQAGVVGVFVSFLSETLARHLNNLAALFTEFMVIVSRLVASLPGASVTLRPPPALVCAAVYVLFVGVLLGLAGRRRRTTGL